MRYFGQKRLKIELRCSKISSVLNDDERLSMLVTVLCGVQVNEGDGAVCWNLIYKPVRRRMVYAGQCQCTTLQPRPIKHPSLRFGAARRRLGRPARPQTEERGVLLGGAVVSALRASDSDSGLGFIQVKI